MKYFASPFPRLAIALHEGACVPRTTSRIRGTKLLLQAGATGIAVISAVQAAPAFAQASDATALQPITVYGEIGSGKGARANVPGFVAKESASATKTATPIAETPQSISVITRDNMTDRAVQSVADSLVYSANVNGQRYGADTRSDYFTVRGFPADLYLDGLRLPQIANQTGGYAGFRIEPYFLNRVDVLRGPSSALFGQTNVGGVVNMISKDPEPTAGGELYTRFGSFSQKETGFDLTGPLGSDTDLSYRLTGVYRDSDTAIDFGKNDRVAINPTIAWQPDDATSLTVYGAYMKDNLGQAGAIVPARGSVLDNKLGLEIPRDFSDGDPRYDTYKKEMSYIGYRFEHEINDNLTFRQNLRYSHLDTVYQNFFTNGLLADDRTITRLNYNAQPVLDAIAVDNNLEYRFNTGAVQHTMLAGLDVQWQKLKNRTGSTAGPNQDLFNPTYDKPFTPAPITTELNQVQRQVGIYLQDQVELGQLKLTASGRYDFVEIESDSKAIATGRKTHYEQDPTKFTGRIGAAYVFDSGIVPYAVYSTSFLPVLTLTDVPLKPTTGALKEVGVKYAPAGDDYTITLSGFEATQQNVVNRVAGVYYQTDEVRVRGIELEATATLWERLNVTAAMSFQEPEVTESQTKDQIGKMPYTVPKQQQSLFVSYDIDAPANLPGDLTIGGGVRHIGKTAGDTANTFFVPGYTLVDAFVRYDYDRYRFQVNGYNLADKTYVAGCNVATQCYFGQGRSVVATASVKW